MLIHSFKIVLSFLLISCITEPVFAAFEVRTTEPFEGEYGNAQTLTFRRAIEGGPMTPEEQAALNAAIPEREDKHYYGRVRVNTSTLSLDQVKNRQNSGIYAGGVPVTNRRSLNQYGLELALGYISSPSTRGDIEYLVNRTLTYNSNPGLSNAPTNAISANIKTNTILLNGYYEFYGISRFKPYLTVGVGATAVSVTSTLTPPSPTTNIGGPTSLRVLRFAYALGGGMRLSFFSHWFLDASYRYISLANPVTIQPSSDYKLNGIYFMNAISLGIVYTF